MQMNVTVARQPPQLISEINNPKVHFDFTTLIISQLPKDWGKIIIKNNNNNKTHRVWSAELGVLRDEAVQSACARFDGASVAQTASPRNRHRPHADDYRTGHPVETLRYLCHLDRTSHWSRPPKDSTCPKRPSKGH